MLLVKQMKLNNITQLEEADFVGAFAELLNYIMCNLEMHEREYTTFAVITKDKLALSSMWHIAQTALKDKITRCDMNNCIWTRKVHVHFSTPSPTALIGCAINIALLDTSTIEGVECAQHIVPFATALTGAKVVLVKKSV